jgi:two-component system, OmpR family, sensor histidine kinase MtrB
LPAQPNGDQVSVMPSRDPIPPRSGATAAPKADPTALPGNGARVVPRPASGARRQDDAPDAEEPPSEEAGHTDDSSKHGEASRGR